MALGIGYAGLVTINLGKQAHVLIAGATGSGKSILIKCLCRQAVEKSATLYIFDRKGGVDFPHMWDQQCRIVLEKAEICEVLKSITADLEQRLRALKNADCADITMYNEKIGKRFERILIVSDEVGELLDSSKQSKEKALNDEITGYLSTIARLGRAAGIHLILGTQRPDATVLTGQVKSNILVRICGRADNTLSSIVLDTTDAKDAVDIDINGRFLMGDGTVFQAFYYDDTAERTFLRTD